MTQIELKSPKISQLISALQAMKMEYGDIKARARGPLDAHLSNQSDMTVGYVHDGYPMVTINDGVW